MTKPSPPPAAGRRRAGGPAPAWPPAAVARRSRASGLTAASTYRCQRLCRFMSVPPSDPDQGQQRREHLGSDPVHGIQLLDPLELAVLRPASRRSAARAPDPRAAGLPVRSTPAVFMLIFPAAAADPSRRPAGPPRPPVPPAGAAPDGRVSPCRGTRTFCPSSRTAARLSWSGSASGALPPAAAMASCRRLPRGNSTIPARTNRTGHVHDDVSGSLPVGFAGRFVRAGHGFAFRFRRLHVGGLGALRSLAG